MLVLGIDVQANGERVLLAELEPGDLDGPVDPALAEQIVCGFDKAEVPFELTPALVDALIRERDARGRILDAEDVLRVARAQDGHDAYR